MGYSLGQHSAAHHSVHFLRLLRDSVPHQCGDASLRSINHQLPHCSHHKAFTRISTACERSEFMDHAVDHVSAPAPDVCEHLFLLAQILSGAGCGNDRGDDAYVQSESLSHSSH